MDKKFLSRVMDVIKNTPPDPDNWIKKRYIIGNEDVYKFASVLMGIEGFSLLMEQDLEAAVYLWCQYYKTELEENDMFFPIILAQFKEVLPKIKFPLKRKIFQTALDKSVKAEEPPEAADYKNPSMVWLICFCYQLQKATGDAPFFLAGKKVAHLLGCSQPWANTLLRCLVKKGILKIVKKGYPGYATRYNYISMESKKRTPYDEGIKAKISSHRKSTN